jgi:16S rRNA (cytosine967-C5)-methyltransferase
MSVSPARRAALEVLLRVFEEGAYADRAFTGAAAKLEPRDRALAQRLAYGTVQRARTLDHAIETIGRRPVRKLDAPVRAALRLGAYQLGYLDAVPRHAAVNESVEAVRAARLERAVPFTNAVMRRLALGLDELLAALPEGTAHEAALKHSYPDWIAEVLWRDLGPDEALAFMRAQNEPPETVVRLVRGEIDGEPTDIPGAYRVARVDEAALAEGRIWPQSRASQLAGLLVGSREGERVLDLCAAPGGKATMLAGEVVAVELHEGRARELEENARRLGATGLRVVNADALALPPDLRDFDRALVDAPCSGLGVLAQRPDLRWRAEPLPELQVGLLRAAVERVRPGGTVVYSVCTVNADENEAVVDALGLEPEPLGEEWPQFAHPRRPEFLLTLPHRDGTSGFFCARLRVPSIG